MAISLSFVRAARFVPVGATRIGRDGAIVQAKEFQTKPGLHHWDSNFLIDVSPSGDVVNLRGAGLLFHRFTRTPEGWLIKYRRYDSPAAVPKMAWPEPAYGLTARGVAADPEAARVRGTLSGGVLRRDRPVVRPRQLRVRHRHGEWGGVCPCVHHGRLAGAVRGHHHRFDDVLVKTREGWRFKTRVYVSEVAAVTER